MFFEKHDERDDYKIWLSQDKIETLLEYTSDSQHQLAFELDVRCGLRSDEIVRAKPADLNDTEAGHMLRVDNAKSDGIRQTPVPDQLATKLKTINDVRPEPSTHPIINSQSSTPGASTRTLRNWISDTSDRIAEEEGDEMWANLTMHDLRRTWATSLKGQDVDAMIVCDWGGWSDLETFLKHYRGTFSPEAQRRQREKVAWL